MIDHFLKYLEFEKRFSPHTLLAYTEDLNGLSDFLFKNFEITEAHSVKHVHLRNWVVSLMDKGISARSINRKQAAVKSYFKFLQARDALKNNPTSKLKPLKTEKQLPQFLRDNEITELLDNQSFKDDFKGKRDQLIMELFYATGIRLAELINLKITDVDFHDESIKVLGKRNKERIIPIHGFIVDTIREYLTERIDSKEPWLLLTNSGKKLYPMFVYRLIKAQLTRVTTLSKKSPHVLRHTFATHMLDKGADLNAVKDLLGHASLAATQVYTHNSMEKLKHAFDQAHPKA